MSAAADTDLIDFARRYGQNARAYNVFGPANLAGYPYGLLQAQGFSPKVSAYLKSGAIPADVTDTEKVILKPVIAQTLVTKWTEPLAVDPYQSPAGLTPDELEIKRASKTLNLLQYVLIHASCGALNCEIANLALGLMLHDRSTVPVSVINFSGYWEDEDRDHTHTFLLLGGDPHKLEDMIFAVMKLPDSDPAAMDGVVVCDPHHDEYYPLSEAFTEAGQRLGRYHDVSLVGEEHDDADKYPRFRRPVFIVNPSEFMARHSDTFSPLCLDLFHQLGNPSIKARVETIYAGLITALSPGGPEAMAKAGAHVVHGHSAHPAGGQAEAAPAPG